MRQYELAIRIAQVHHLVDERKYKKALAVIQTLDLRQIRSLSDLKVFAEVYTKTEQYEAAKATYLRIYRRSRTRRVLYRLIYLSIRTNALEDAEAYYREFVQMNPNGRDALILRYRIDKAAGVPIGRLIEILQALKQEEYIEEWAYELAKLYHRAGRKQECLEECQDILLWFGTGEVVERAKILIDHLQDRDPIPYYDDKDFTVPKKEDPNPEDTGSLPDLNEFIKERRAKKKEARRQGNFEDDYRDDDIASIMKEDLPEKDEEPEAEATKPVAKESRVAAKKEEPDDTFIDDYEEDDFEEVDISQKAKDSIQKLSGLLKLGKREEEKEKEEKKIEEGEKTEEPEKKEEPVVQRTKPVNTKKEKEATQKYVPHSQSGTGITQDLAKEISAIYEMEHREQLKEKAVTVINEVPNIATNVVDRMTQAIQKSSGRGYIPIDIEEIHENPGETARKAEEREKARKAAEAKKQREEEKARKEAEAKRKEEEEKARKEAEEAEAKRKEEEEKARAEAKEEIEEEPPKDALMEALDAEVEEYYENLRKTGTQEEEVIETAVDKDETVGEEEEETAIESLDAVPEEEQKTEAEILKDLLEEEIQDPETEENQEKEQAVEEEEREIEEEEQEEKEQKESQEKSEEESTQEEPQEETAASENVSPLENYRPPEIPVVETDYMEIPEISFEDLPTTRALQQSFQNVLQLIAGELDPSHFVLMGDGGERIVGVSKHIVRIMKDTGYLSQGRIAKINAVQLNKMDLITFRSQLKGNCLLIESAADLLFPTITKIFSIMEEYYGDFVVILADEGTTLDQLFRFVPVLAKKFKYIIDISKYTEKDYQ